MGGNMRIGCGYDVHRLIEGRRLILGGVEIPYERGLLGHSDADVLLHAISDALLGAAALGDIGKHFPDSDPAYEGADLRCSGDPRLRSLRKGEHGGGTRLHRKRRGDRRAGRRSDRGKERGRARAFTKLTHSSCRIRIDEKGES